MFKKYPARYLFYYESDHGEFTSIFGHKLAKYETSKSSNFYAEKKKHEAAGSTLYESDCNVTFRCLSDNYEGATLPKPNIAYFDIEVDFDSDRGYSTPEDPFNRITSIGVHLGWLDQTICLAMKPDSMTFATAQEIVDGIPNAVLMETEEELLDTFLGIIDDADILTGWNSETYDIPYLVERIKLVIGNEHNKKFCLWNQLPKRKTIERFKKKMLAYELIGRVHLDYLELYRKYTYEEKHSYALDFISDIELGEKKVEYNGTLDQLYNDDFKKFIEYNIQDVELLKKMDTKLQFIELAISIAHSNMVLLQTTMGSVQQIDQAVINQAHSMGLIVRDKIRQSADSRAAGAYVFPPRKGLHQWVGSMDLSSLYPSILRSSNMSPDTIVAQIEPTYTQEDMEKWETSSKKSDELYWDGKFGTVEYDLVMNKDTKREMTVNFENGDSHNLTGADIYELVFESSYGLSRNGTIFTFEKDGIIPALLGRWYSERKKTQAEARDARDVDEDRYKYLDRRQLVRKILLNSAYGALLNEGSRFFDPRLGQSVTLNGRGISRHMASKVNEIITGEYDYLGDAILYGDTDSTYFTASSLIHDEMPDEDIINLYDVICDQANETFVDYMTSYHNCPVKYGEIISAARETVCKSALFIKKKKYGLLIMDDDGKRMDVDGKEGKVKVKGLESQRSDTPKYMQKFLEELLERVLSGASEDDIISRIKEYRKEFREMDSWQKGSPKRINNLTNLTNQYMKTGKCHVGHAMAAINYNEMLELHNDKHSMRITDGMKTIVAKLKPNAHKMRSIAIPIDENIIPEWFQELPFDDELMEETIVTKKIMNLLEVMDWNLSESNSNENFDSFLVEGN